LTHRAPALSTGPLQQRPTEAHAALHDRIGFGNRGLPAQFQKRFSTVIRDVTTTGNSGSGVFDAGQKCLLGIMSRKILVRSASADKESEQKDIAKYFVPASTIRAFIPTEYRF
jgi:hypothetical protein